MKKISILLAIIMIATFALFAVGSGEDSDSTVDQGNDTVKVSENDNNDADDTTVAEDNSSLGDYSVVIDSCRMAKDYEGKDIIIVKYIFTNVSDDDAASFSFAIEDAAYQNGVGLNETYFVNESANYDSGTQLKEIKKGASLEVEIAYKLDDTTSDVEVEVSELISFDDKTIKKTFTIA